MAWTTARWRASVVRMKSSLPMPSRRQVSRNAAAISSAKAWGVTPARAAAWAMLSPCSSVPVRKCTRSPRSRRYRHMASAMIVVQAWPRCGRALT